MAVTGLAEDLSSQIADRLEAFNLGGRLQRSLKEVEIERVDE